ncbi:GAF domain-containing protein [Granulicella paludicola]|uniref:GAF domain-containing protein n=1 Tax=Granulicella paludicola TaxID=474951 RepID=UPI0021E0990F|nr:GAF domain-containing protein [Granulicella paludicola]
MFANVEDTGLEVVTAREDVAFTARRLHVHDIATQMEGLQRLSQALLNHPDTVLQELVNVAVTLCGADSAGISIQIEDGTDREFYRWVATAGEYSGFLGATLPRYPSACGMCLERGKAQHFTVDKRFFDILNVEAPLVTDGILLPWDAEGTRGTIFVMAHGRKEAFDESDVRLMEMLANFAAMGFKQQAQQKRLVAQERAAAAAMMANELAHQINNPLQSMTNMAYMVESGTSEDPKSLGAGLSQEIRQLSRLVEKILLLPLVEAR